MQISDICRIFLQTTSLNNAPWAHDGKPTTVPPVDHVGRICLVQVDHVRGQLLVAVIVVVVVHPAQSRDVAVGVVDVTSRGRLPPE